MSFLYEVIWIERVELLNVWLGRQNDEVDDGDNGENNDHQADGPQQNAGQAAAGADQGVGAQVRAGRNPARGIQNGRDNNRPQAPANNRRGGMIRRGANGGFLHDIQCLVFSFVLSLIPAWKPEEAAAPPDESPEQPESQPEQDPLQQQGTDDGVAAAAGNGAEND